MVEEDVRKRGVGFIGVEVGQIDAGCGEGSVGWCKHRERTIGLQGLNKACMGEGCNQGVVRARVGGNRWNVVELRFVRWRREDLVDDVNDAVRSHDVWGGDSGVSDLHGVGCHRERGFIAVEHGDGQSVGDGAGFHRSVVHVVQENVCECGVGFVGVEVGQVDAGCGECIVRWGEHRERAVGLQGLNKARMGEGCDQ